MKVYRAMCDEEANLWITFQYSDCVGSSIDHHVDLAENDVVDLLFEDSTVKTIV